MGKSEPEVESMGISIWRKTYSEPEVLIPRRTGAAARRRVLHRAVVCTATTSRSSRRKSGMEKEGAERVSIIEYHTISSI